MPRKITPRWGEDGVVAIPRPQIPDEVLADLAARLGLTGPENRLALKDRLEELAWRHRRWTQQDEDGPSRAVQNAALSDVADTSEALTAMLARLDASSEGRLFDALLMRPTERRLGPVTWLDRLEDELSHLAMIARRLAAEASPGPRPRTTLRWGIVQLIALYEEITGERFTHSDHDGVAHTGEPRSAGGQFVRAFYAWADPAVRPTTVNTLLAEAVRHRNALRET